MKEVNVLENWKIFAVGWLVFFVAYVWNPNPSNLVFSQAPDPFLLPLVFLKAISMIIGVALMLFGLFRGVSLEMGSEHKR